MRRKKRARRHDYASAGSKAGELGLQPAYEGVGGEEVAAMGGLDPGLFDEAGGIGVVAVAAMGRLDPCVAETALPDGDEMLLSDFSTPGQSADGMTSPMLIQGSASSDFHVVDIGRGPSPLDMAPSSPAPIGIRRGPSTPHSLAGSAPATPVQTHAAQGAPSSPAIVASPEHFALPAPAVVASPSAPLVPENVAAPRVPPAPPVPPADAPLPYRRHKAGISGVQFAASGTSKCRGCDGRIAYKSVRFEYFWIKNKPPDFIHQVCVSVWSDCLQTFALT